MSIRFVKDCIARISRLIMPPAGPVDDFEYPNLSDNAGRSFREPVGRWKYNAAINYQSMADITKSQVAELQWYKNVEGMEHEYIVVTCRRGGEGPVYLRLERRAADIDHRLVIPELALSHELTEDLTEEQLNEFKVDVEAEQRVIKRTVCHIIQRVVSKSKNNLKFADSVMRVANPEGFLEEEAQLISRYENFKQPFYVRDLAFLACAVSEHDPNYQFFVPEGYWYSRMLVDATLAIYQPTTITPGDSFKAAGTYTVGKRLRPESERIVQVLVGNDGQEVDLIKNTLRDSIALHDRLVSPTRLYQRTSPLDQPHQGSQAPPTAPVTSHSVPLGPGMEAMIGLIQRIPTGPNVINFITINPASGNVTGNTHTNINNVASRGAHHNAQRRGNYPQVDRDREIL